jgi:hypothetical protein
LAGRILRGGRRATTSQSGQYLERLNGIDGIGAIVPAMANSVMMFDALGYPRDHPDLVTARASIECQGPADRWR